jgi:hypothetical protein
MRRIPLLALAVLLVGCESPVAPELRRAPSGGPRPPSVTPSVSFEIAGPFRVDSAGSVTWQAFAFGGSGSYQYRWEVVSEDGSSRTASAESRLSLLVGQNDGNFSVRLTVTSGDQTRIDSITVRNCIGGCR